MNKKIQQFNLHEYQNTENCLDRDITMSELIRKIRYYFKDIQKQVI